MHISKEKGSRYRDEECITERENPDAVMFVRGMNSRGNTALKANCSSFWNEVARQCGNNCNGESLDIPDELKDSTSYFEDPAIWFSSAVFFLIHLFSRCF